MLATRPPNGEGISTVALSVSTSRSGASSAMTSPSSTRTLTISASVSPSPRSGSANGRDIASEREGRARGGDDPGYVGDVGLLAGEADERHVVRGHASDRRLEEDHGVRIADGGGQQRARITRARWNDHLQPGNLGVELLLGLRVMFEGANASPVWHANHHGDVKASLRARPVARAVVLDLVEALKGEARELDLADGLEAVEGHADGGPDDGCFGQRAVDDALGTELPLQIIGHAEDAAVHADVLAQDEHVSVALHRLEEGEVERLDHVQLGHRVSAASVAGPASAWGPAASSAGRPRAPGRPAHARPSPRAGP